MTGRRHSAEEIATKLEQANELATKGKTQREISKVLGVSLMTYHRWRKGQDESNTPQSPDEIATEATGNPIELENLRLRRLVIDLLLEKLRLEEAIQGRGEGRFRGGR